MNCQSQDRTCVSQETNQVVPLELSCKSYPPTGEILEEVLSEAEDPYIPQAGGISPTSPLRVDSNVSPRHRCDIIPVDGLGSETQSLLQLVSRESASTSSSRSQGANVVGLAETPALEDIPAVMGNQYAEGIPIPEAAVQRP